MLFKLESGRYARVNTMDRVRLNEDAYNCIARQLSALGSYPSWEELVTNGAKHFAVPVFGGWLAPLRHAFIEGGIADCDTVYAEILKAFEHLTSIDPYILWPTADAVEKAELQFWHVEDGWFELKLKRYRTRLRTRHALTSLNCEARAKELARAVKCLRRTTHVTNRSHLFSCSKLPESVRSQWEISEEPDGVGKKKRSYKNMISKPLREELNHSLCVVAEQLETEGAELDWTSVFNLSERPYNANGPKQYGVSLLSYLDGYGKNLQMEMRAATNGGCLASDTVPKDPCSHGVMTNPVDNAMSTATYVQMVTTEQGTACTMEEQGGVEETVPYLCRRKSLGKVSRRKATTVSTCAGGEMGANTMKEEGGGQSVRSARRRT